MPELTNQVAALTGVTHKDEPSTNASTAQASINAESENKNWPTSKDIVDYLRNEQRNEEKRSRISGINSWALWAAGALMVWELARVLTLPLPPLTIDLVLHGVVLTIFVHGLLTHTRRGEIDLKPRFKELSLFRESEAPILGLAGFIWVLIPLVLYVVFVYPSPAIAFMLFITLCVICYSVYHDIVQAPGRFPAPVFEERNRKNTKRGLGVIAALAIWQVAMELNDLRTLATQVNRQQFQVVILIVGLYWVVSLLISKQMASVGGNWTHTLERQLLLGVITTDQALRRIEQRTLGTRLSAVIDDFWLELEGAQTRASEAVQRALLEFENVQSIPLTYATERRTRMHPLLKNATTETKAALKLIQEVNEFASNALKGQKTAFNIDVLEAINGIMNRSKVELAKITALERELSRLSEFE